MTDRARLPEYQTSGPAGADVFAAFDGPAIELAPGTGEVSTTGIALELPLGGEAQIRSRSGLPAEHGIIVLNSPGTIDSDYRGELKVILFNTSNAPFSGSGDRIAQLVIAPFVQAEFQSLPEISEAPRGGRGPGQHGDYDIAFDGTNDRFRWWAHGMNATHYSFVKEECGHEASTSHVFFCCSAIGNLGPMAGWRVYEVDRTPF
ncbi:deoxyuridine 5'-triphosphate nucleotidohydrolase [Rhizobium leguminosarum]|uniref:dUTP diphosphatase n=1 Tax=Rhizobium leguminosarum TaxID=384 RepID=UPI00180289D1|nr:dUTP diphosphatase [Rhizobium leguminosarum]MBB4524957.1 deoxyuridine 5'-triphosphate nucleotidohydrolase [Rhizobium leguminosarum]